jgi:nitrilase
MRATVIQFEASADRQANLAAMQDLAARAIRSERPSLLSLPEMWSCLGGSRAVKLSQSESLPGPGEIAEPGSAYAFLSGLASGFGITVHGGSIGERDGERLFNTTLVFGPDGREVARYRKIHLFDVVTPGGQGYRESALFGAGEHVVTCRAGALTLGLSICYDLRFPELFLALRRDGAEVILVPAAFTTETGRDHWEVLLRARAIETQCWIVAAATTGTHEDASGAPRHTFGHSMICDPWGRIAASLADQPGFVSAEIDTASMARMREAMPVLEHRRLV